MRGFGHLKRKSVYDWKTAFRNMEVVGVKGRGRKPCSECMEQNMDLLGQKQEWWSTNVRGGI